MAPEWPVIDPSSAHFPDSVSVQTFSEWSRLADTIEDWSEESTAKTAAVWPSRSTEWPVSKFRTWIIGELVAAAKCVPSESQQVDKTSSIFPLRLTVRTRFSESIKWIFWLLSITRREFSDRCKAWYASKSGSDGVTFRLPDSSASSSPLELHFLSWPEINLCKF